MDIKDEVMEIELSRAQIDQWQGALVLEFGASWCGYCQAAQPLIQAAFTCHPKIHHIKIEDGKGKRLGRSFMVKLWPTLIFMMNGREIKRLVYSGPQFSDSELRW
jgi:thioredoxin 1